MSSLNYTHCRTLVPAQGMGWSGIFHPRFEAVLVPILPLQLPWLVAVGLAGLDDRGSGGIYPTPRFCLPVVCDFYCPRPHYSPGMRDGSAGKSVAGARFEEGTSVFVPLAAARFSGTMVAATAAASLVLFECDCETLSYRI